MCIIIVGKITKRHHEAAKLANGDGFSLFTAEQGLVKAPTDKQVAQAIGKFGIWHYRIATSGDRKSIENVHPFKVCRSKYLLYHNGVLGDGLGEKSDTHALADLLQHASTKTAETVLKSLASTRNRFVIADAKDPTKFYVYGEWVTDAGVLLSHRMDLTTRAVVYAGSTAPRYPSNYTRDLAGYGHSIEDYTGGED
jgi:glutamine phosphoribosylpyrophosphate amidotransferase